jgi:hypothetical protein
MMGSPSSITVSIRNTCLLVIICAAILIIPAQVAGLMSASAKHNTWKRFATCCRQRDLPPTTPSQSRRLPSLSYSYPWPVERPAFREGVQGRPASAPARNRPVKWHHPWTASRPQYKEDPSDGSQAQICLSRETIDNSLLQAPPSWPSRLDILSTTAYCSSSHYTIPSDIT